jgi:hypothetical protein
MTTATIENREQFENQEQAEAQLAGLARLGMLLDQQGATDFPDLLERHIEERTELERESALSLEIERTVRIVLCTGGPHCEIRWPERGTPSIVCYGWFGAGRFERELTRNEQRAIEYTYGDFDELVSLMSERDN